MLQPRIDRDGQPSPRRPGVRRVAVGEPQRADARMIGQQKRGLHHPSLGSRRRPVETHDLRLARQVSRPAARDDGRGPKPRAAAADRRPIAARGDWRRPPGPSPARRARPSPAGPSATTVAPRQPARRPGRGATPRASGSSGDRPGPTARSPATGDPRGRPLPGPKGLRRSRRLAARPIPAGPRPPAGSSCPACWTVRRRGTSAATESPAGTGPGPRPRRKANHRPPTISRPHALPTAAPAAPPGPRRRPAECGRGRPASRPPGPAWPSTLRAPALRPTGASPACRDRRPRGSASPAATPGGLTPRRPSRTKRSSGT